jgi:antitoxin VapB
METLVRFGKVWRLGITQHQLGPATRRKTALRHIAKLFTGDDGQLVQLPAEIRMTSTEVLVRRDPNTGDVILSEKPRTWDGFFAALEGLEVPEDFLDLEERKRMPHDPDPFADFDE